jgi:hypothetical protein
MDQSTLAYLTGLGLSPQLLAGLFGQQQRPVAPLAVNQQTPVQQPPVQGNPYAVPSWLTPQQKGSSGGGGSSGGMGNMMSMMGGGGGGGVNLNGGLGAPGGSAAGGFGAYA